MQEVDEDGLVTSTLPMVAHRATPADDHRLTFSSSLSKGVNGVGGICLEKLTDVWADGLARCASKFGLGFDSSAKQTSYYRINNGLDSEIMPFEQDEVVERALDAVFRPNDNTFLRCYNSVTNNCEHFATYLRNGWGISRQVCQVLNWQVSKRF